MPIRYGWKPRTTFTELDDTPGRYEEPDLAVRVKADLAGVEFGAFSGMESNPPSGMCRVTSIYYDPETDEHVIVRSDNPEP